MPYQRDNQRSLDMSLGSSTFFKYRSLSSLAGLRISQVSSTNLGDKVSSFVGLKKWSVVRKDVYDGIRFQHLNQPLYLVELLLKGLIP
ncbi:hypothetical protein EDD56_1419 [Pseudobacteriovorax antillogorgiicola]|nr:hypothetical protein EDD56_1419 [Pseudobacteriovorax antillogorgiicola]